MNIRPGQVWQDDYYGPSRILAVAEGYAMMRRDGCNPFLLPLGALKAGAHGWHRLSENEMDAYIKELEEPICDACHEPLGDGCPCQHSYASEHDSGAER